VALEFGALFLALQVAGELAERATGSAGFYLVSAIGGTISSASAVASAAALATAGDLRPDTAGFSAVLASATSAFISVPLLIRIGRNHALARRTTAGLAMVLLLGLVGVALQLMLATRAL
jgi:uncharacterized membrane protein (DUF4010 family)